MTRTRSLAALLALSGIALLPACSMFGGDSRSSSRTSYSSRSSAAAPDYSNSAQASAPALAGPLTPDMVRSVQQSLQQDGLYRGPVDGVWGPGTHAAVRSYQQQHNINVTGQLDPDTLSAMNIGVQRNAQQEPPASQRYGSYNPQDSNAAGQPNAGVTR